MRENADWTDAYTTKPVGGPKKPQHQRPPVTDRDVLQALGKLKNAANHGDTKAVSRIEHKIDRLMRQWR